MLNMKPKCIDCGKIVNYYAKRCRKCYGIYRSKIQTGKDNPNYKNGKPKCITCGAKASYGHKFCSRKCFGLSERGNKHNNFSGLTDLSIRIKNLLEYKEWRKSVFERDDYICQKCFVRGGHLDPHHIKYYYLLIQDFLKQYSQFSPIDDKETLVRLAVSYTPLWDVSNGKTLCRDCHNKTKGVNQYARRGNS
jgi:hypothetical protein